MKIQMKISSASKTVTISDEHSASSYGIPVAIVDGVAYGLEEFLPIWAYDELIWLNEPAKTTVAGACLEMQKEGCINDEQIAFLRKFYDEPWR